MQFRNNNKDTTNITASNTSNITKIYFKLID